MLTAARGNMLVETTYCSASKVRFRTGDPLGGAHVPRCRALDTVTVDGWRTKVSGGRVVEHATKDAADAVVNDAGRRYHAGARALRVVRRTQEVALLRRHRLVLL